MCLNGEKRRPLQKSQRQIAEEHLLALKEKLAQYDKPKDITDYKFPKQAAFCASLAPLIAGFCTRRAGKSYGIAIKLCNAALQHPGVSCIYIGLTRDSTKRIMFKDIFKAINKKHKLGIHFNHTELSATFPNGSIIYFVGMDSSPDEMEKALGQKFKLAVIDEAGSFRQDLRKIVYAILKPACADLRGQIVMIGTAQDLTKGLFFDTVWAKTEPGWEIHNWSATDNPYMAEQWQEEIDELIKNNPRIAETPWFKQNYLGMYVVDQTKLVYKYNEEINLIKKSNVPDLHNYVLGIDLGFDDATAFSLLGFRHDSKKLYVVHTSKESGLDLTSVKERIEWYMNRYRPYKFIVDGANKQGVKEMVNRMRLPLEAADKSAKADFISIMNNDFIAGLILLSDACGDLSTEYNNLIWDDKELAKKKKVEHPNCENHLTDATLYAWRYCYQYVWQPEPRKLTEDERMNQQLEHEAHLIELESQKEKSWLETM